jgi:outer membrane receptor protein involved in Fe transport
VGRRIVEAGILPLPDAYEEARHLLDLSLRIPLLSALTARLDAKNLLDQPYRVTQGGMDQLRYTTGRQFAVGFTWTP